MELKYRLLWRTIFILLMAVVALFMFGYGAWTGFVREQWAEASFYLLMVVLLDQSRESMKRENEQILKQIAFHRDYGRHV